MSELFDAEFLKKLQQLVIAIKIVSASNTAGNRKSRSKGSSIEFSDFREYTPGDDFRRIDWNAYGRLEKLFVKLFLEEREAAVHIYLDTSRSMDWGEPSKSTASRRLAAALCYMSLSNYDCISVSCVSDKCEKSKLSLRGKNSFGDVLGFLENIEYAGGTNLYKAVDSSPARENKGVSIIISDLQPSKDLYETIKLLQFKKQEVYVFHMLSPQEINPEINSSLCLIDSETRETRNVTVSQQLLKEYRKVYASYIREIEENCLKRGAGYILFESDMEIEKMMNLAVNRLKK